MKELILVLIFLPCILFGQINPDRHNTSWTDTWVSCTTSLSPNILRGESHWFMMDLGYNYTLGQSKLWNYNAPENLDRGIQDYFIDYSLDGTNWTELGQYILNQTNGSGYYEGEAGPNFNQLNARYILITPISNYGGECYGLSEIKIAIESLILPVEITEFAAECRNGKPYIYWTVENEVNSDRYDVEVSKNGTDWKLLKSIPSNNKSNQNQFYYIVNNIYSGGLEYYRLKHFDFDGTEQISELAKGYCEELNIVYNIAPNPFVNEIQLTTKSDEDFLLEYKVLNSNGVLVKENSLSINKGDNKSSIELKEIPSGEYSIMLNKNNQITSFKIVKL
jgi:hypothetical protein